MIVWVGIKESEVIYTHDFFSYSITLYGSGISGNHALSCKKENRTNLLSDENKIPFYIREMHAIINKHNDVRFMFYSPVTAYKIIEHDPSLLEFVTCLNNRHQLLLLEDKMRTRLWMSNKIPAISSTIVSGSECTYENLCNLFQASCAVSFVVQKNVSSGGNGTFLLRDNNDFGNTFEMSKSELLLVAPFKKSGVSVNYHLLLAKETFLIFPPSVQIIQEIEGKLLYKGGDFFAATMLTASALIKLREAVELVAQSLLSIGYMGICGVDLLFDDGVVYFVEINGRFQASSILLNASLYEKGYMSLQEQNLRVFNDCDPQLSQKDVDFLHVKYSFYKYENDNTDKSNNLATKYDQLTVSPDREIVLLNGFNPEISIDYRAYAFDAVYARNIVSANRYGSISLHPNISPIDTWKEEIIDFRCDSEYLIKLKIALLNQGVQLTKEANEIITCNGGINASVYSSIDISISNFALRVNCPVNTYLCSLSPYYIRAQFGKLVLTYNTTYLCSIKYERENSLKQLVTKSGIPYNQIAFISGDRLRIKYQKYCYYKINKAGCKFCPSSKVLSANPDIPLQDIQEVFDYCLHNFEFRHVLIGGGSASPDSNHIHILPIARYIRSQTNKPIYLMTIPPFKEDVLKMYYQAGISEIAFNIEVFDREIAAQLMPGKGTIKLKTYMEALKNATSIFGEHGEVRSMLVLGLEGTQSFIDGIESLSKIHVQPMISIYRALNNCQLSNHIQPENQYIFDVYSTANAICKEHNLYLGPSCESCQNNTLSLPFSIL